MSYFERAKIYAADSMSTDAFGRWRVSNPLTLFDGVVGGADNLKFSTVTTGVGTTNTTNALRASVTLSTTANTVGSIARQSTYRFKYVPGKSQLVAITFVMGSGVGGNTKRVGYFDERNGIFLQQNGSEISLNRRTYTSGSTVDNKVVQADWNVDRLDGTGPSGVTVDFTKTQILLIDLQWLGVGRVRVAFDIDGIARPVHEFLNANNLDVVYMSTATLPIRYELTHNGTGSASSLECICSTVIGEGGEEPLGIPRAQILSLGAVTANTAYVVAGIKHQSGNAAWRTVIELTSATLMATTNNDFFGWYLLLDPTVTGSLSYGSYTASDVAIAAGDGSQTVNSVGTETILKGGLGFSQGSVSVTFGDNIRVPVTANGVSRPLVLVVLPLSNLTLYAALNWREL